MADSSTPVTITKTTTAKAKIGDVVLGRAANNDIVVGVVLRANVDLGTITITPLPISNSNTIAEGKYVLASPLVPEIKLEERKNAVGTRTFQQ